MTRPVTSQHRHDQAHRGLVPTAQLGTGAAGPTTVLYGNQTWGAAGGDASTLDGVTPGAEGLVILATATTSAARTAVGRAFSFFIG